MKLRLEPTPMERLNPDDAVKKPDGQSPALKSDDVREGPAVLGPEGTPHASRLECVGGRWKVDARPFIAAGKVAEARNPRPRAPATGSSRVVR
jgi:hypothetical protein